MNHITRREIDDCVPFYVPSSSFSSTGGTFNMAAVRELRKTTFKSFDQFVKFGYGKFWAVKVSKSQSECGCPKFLKKFICKHVIGLVLRMKLCVLPRAAIPTALGKRTRGRHTKSVKALLIQTFRYSDILIDIDI